MYLHLYDIVSTVTFLLGYCKKSTTAAAVYSLLHASGQITFSSAHLSCRKRYRQTEANNKENTLCNINCYQMYLVCLAIYTRCCSIPFIKKMLHTE